MKKSILVAITVLALSFSALAMDDEKLPVHGNLGPLLSGSTALTVVPFNVLWVGAHSASVVLLACVVFEKQLGGCEKLMSLSKLSDQSDIVAARTVNTTADGRQRAAFQQAQSEAVDFLAGEEPGPTLQAFVETTRSDMARLAGPVAAERLTLDMVAQVLVTPVGQIK